MYTKEYNIALGSNELDGQKATYGEIKIFKQKRGNKIKCIAHC